jgi:hypothetical protein
MIDTVALEAGPLDPSIVLHELTVTHGRRSAFDTGPAASTATLVLLPAGTLPPVSGGDLMQLSGPAGALFTGRITDRALTYGDTPEDGPELVVTAMGTASRLGLRPVGDVPWPQEPASSRAARILTAAQVPHTITADPARDYPVIPLDLDATPAADALTDLAAAPPAAVVDTPNGSILYQQLTSRAIDVPYRWSDFPPAEEWQGLAADLTWDGTAPSLNEWTSPASDPITVPPAAVTYAPAWSAAESDVVNHSRAGWGTVDPQPTVEAEHAASIARHGRRYTYTATQLANAVDATDFVTSTLTARATDRWALPDVEINLDACDPDTAAALLRSQCGQPVRIGNLPTPGPATAWAAILEGWTYTQTATDTGVLRLMRLALSDPLHSVIAMTWTDYPGTYVWDDHPPALTWADLTTTETLEAS